MGQKISNWLQKSELEKQDHYKRTYECRGLTLLLYKLVSIRMFMMYITETPTQTGLAIKEHFLANMKEKQKVHCFFIIALI